MYLLDLITKLQIKSLLQILNKYLKTPKVRPFGGYNRKID